MRRRDKIIIWVGIAIVLAATGLGLARMRSIRVVTGAILRDDPVPENQLTIPDATVSAGDEGADPSAKTDAAGYFQLKLPNALRKGETLTLHLRHPGYRPLDITVLAADRLYVLRMTRISTPPIADGIPVVIGDMRLRYALTSRRTENVGSAVKVFEVPNVGDVPCGSSSVCSPDRKWKAAVGSASLDAGDDNEFQDARVSCIAGPCPFTKVEKDSFSHGGRHISVSVRNWSDPASFVLEAEVMHTMTNNSVLHSYPVIFNRTASFTLPAKAQGPSIEATVDRQEIVFPLGPKPKLSWADCDVQTEKDLTKLYRCVLKSGYRFP